MPTVCGELQKCKQWNNRTKIQKNTKNKHFKPTTKGQKDAM